jgi:hypothetical protein
MSNSSEITEKREREELMKKLDDFSKGIKRCPNCSGIQNKIIKKTNYRHVGSRIGRFGTRAFYYFDATRECLDCSKHFTTHECEEK